MMVRILRKGRGRSFILLNRTLFEKISKSYSVPATDNFHRGLEF